MSESIPDEDFYFEKQRIPALFDNPELHQLCIRVGLAVDMLRSRHGAKRHSGLHLANDCRSSFFRSFKVEGFMLDEDGETTNETVILTTKQLDKVTRKGVGIEVQAEDGEAEVIWLEANSLRIYRDSEEQPL